LIEFGFLVLKKVSSIRALTRRLVVLYSGMPVLTRRLVVLYSGMPVLDGPLVVLYSDRWLVVLYSKTSIGGW
jgi:hypothetical protein